MAITIKRRPEAAQRFPFIPLPRAIERARELYKVANGHEVPLATAMGAWSYAERSSGGLQTAAALKAFGLLVDVVGRDRNVRKVKLTETALRIIRDPRDISPDRDGLIREAALRPPLHKEIIEKYGGMPPSDEALKAFLLMDRGLKDEAVPEFIREFAATMAFAKVAESGTIQDMGDALEQACMENFSDDLVTSRSVGARPADHDLPPMPVAPGIRREIFALDEGDLVISYPEELSPASYEDLEAYLQLFLRKAKRRVGAGADDA